METRFWRAGLPLLASAIFVITAATGSVRGENPGTATYCAYYIADCIGGSGEPAQRRVRHAAHCRCKACGRRMQELADRTNLRRWHAMNSSAIDRRDTQAYSAGGYGVPVSVPLAPTVGYAYNHGWGVPSSRLTVIGASYDRWYPETWYTQAGGGPQAAGNNPPVIYQPTDTTEQGFYYKHVPAWQPGPLGGWQRYPVVPRFTR